MRILGNAAAYVTKAVDERKVCKVPPTGGFCHPNRPPFAHFLLAGTGTRWNEMAMVRWDSNL